MQEDFVEVVVLVCVNHKGEHIVVSEDRDAPDVAMNDLGYETSNIRTVSIKVKVPRPVATELELTVPAGPNDAATAEAA